MRDGITCPQCGRFVATGELHRCDPQRLSVVSIPPGAGIICKGVVIDDQCDGCGPMARGRRGAVFLGGRAGPPFPVICDKCIERAHLLLSAQP